MREIQVSTITGAVKQLCMDANFFLGDDVVQRLQDCMQNEQSPTGKEVLKKIIENADIAKTEHAPLCQDQ